MTTSEDEELRAAHRRIEELEGRFVREASTPISGRRVLSLVVFAFCLITSAVAVAWLGVPRRERIVVGAPPSPPPPIPSGVLCLRIGPAFVDRGPALIDIDGDGAKDLVVLAWRHGQDALPLHAVAFDRKTYAVRWRAGPYPARWRGPSVRLNLAAPNVHVTDGAGKVHVLDVRTGTEIATTDEAVLVDRDAVDGSCASDGTRVCTTATDPRVAEKIAGHFHTHTFPTDYVMDGDRFTHVSVSGGRGDSIEHGVLWEPGASKPRWSAPLIPAPQLEKSVRVSPNAWTALAHGRVLHLYQSAGGPFRIAGRDVKSGTLLFDAAVPGLPDGSAIGALTADAEDAFIVANESLFVIDGRTGLVVQRLAHF